MTAKIRVETRFTDCIRIVARQPDPGEVADFPGAALAVKYTGGIGGSWEDNNVATAAAAAGWGAHDALRAVQAAHRADSPPRPAIPSADKVKTDRVLTWCLATAAILAHVPLFLGSAFFCAAPGDLCLFWPAMGIGVPIVLTLFSGAQVVLGAPFAWTFLATTIEAWREMAADRESVGWPFVAMAVVGYAWALSRLPVAQAKANYKAEAAKLLKAIGRAKMGSPGSVIEVWVADGIGGWARA